MPSPGESKKQKREKTNSALKNTSKSEQSSKNKAVAPNYPDNYTPMWSNSEGLPNIAHVFAPNSPSPPTFDTLSFTQRAEFTRTKLVHHAEDPWKMHGDEAESSSEHLKSSSHTHGTEQERDPRLDEVYCHEMYFDKLARKIACRFFSAQKLLLEPGVQSAETSSGFLGLLEIGLAYGGVPRWPYEGDIYESFVEHCHWPEGLNWDRSRTNDWLNCYHMIRFDQMETAQEICLNWKEQDEVQRAGIESQTRSVQESIEPIADLVS